VSAEVADALERTHFRAVEVGDEWRIEPKPKCQSCHVELDLRYPDKPGRLAVRAAALIGLCEKCAAEEEEAIERAKLQQALDNRIGDSQLPEPLRGLEFDAMITKGKRTLAIEAAKDWAQRADASGMFIYGETGTGKTRLAATATYYRLAHVGPVRFVSVAVLMAQIGAAFNDTARRDAIAVITGKGALVLDDLDKVSPSAWARQQLYAAINARCQAGAPLFVTANVNPRRLRDLYGEAIASRLQGYCATYELTGPDYRLTLDEEADDARL
jgi:DNA replication protein DnaC